VSAASAGSITVLSRVVLDEIVEDDGTTRVVLGGSGFWAAYGAATVADGVALASRVGTDFAPFLPQFSDLGIGTMGLLPSVHPTSRTLITYSGEQVRHEEFVGGWDAHLRMRAYLPELPRVMREASALYVFRDLPPGFWGPVLEHVAGGATLMWEIPGAVCAAPLSDEARIVLRATSILSINREEAADLVGPGDERATLERLLALGPRKVVLRLGSRGSIVSDGHRVVAASVARAATVKDPTGAGNAYSGAFLAATISGSDLAESARTATAVAATAIAQVGTPSDRVSARAETRRLAESVTATELAPITAIAGEAMKR
jgi:sugar/nucleoside kinase (ribokinase family)